jgi:hypothetical protein
MRVVLGNRHAVDQGEKMPKGKRATTIDFPEGMSLGDAFVNVTHPHGVWANHATEGAAPAWVASDSQGLAALLSEHFGGIEIRELEDPAT